MGIAIVSCVLAVLIVTAAVRVMIRHERRDPLGHCPVCTSDAASSVDQDGEEALVIRCGACGTWRRVAASANAARLLELRLERQLGAMKQRAERLERERMGAV
jgi:hypothetical protein